MSLIDDAIALIEDIREEAAGDSSVLAMLEAKEAELWTLVSSTPEELIKLIRELKKEIQGMAPLEEKDFSAIDSRLSELEIRFDNLNNEDKAKVQEEIDVLYITINKLDNQLVDEAKQTIRNANKDPKIISEAVERVDNCLDYMKNNFKQFDSRVKKAIDVEEDWTKFKKPFAEGSSSSISGSETINLDLRICHHKGKLAFDKKDALIEELEDLVKVEFDEIVDEIRDLKKFKETWKDEVEKDAKKKADKLIKQIEKLLKKEEKKEQKEYLVGLQVSLKKVGHNGQARWVFDNSTSAPAKQEAGENDEAALSIEPAVKVSGDGNLTNKLVYTLNIKRNGFTYKKLNGLAFAGVIAQQATGVIVAGESDDGIGAGTVGTAVTGTINGLNTSLEDETAGEANAALEITLTLNQSNGQVEAHAVKIENFANLNFKKKHLYELNFDEAVSVFNTNLSKLN